MTGGMLSGFRDGGVGEPVHDGQPVDQFCQPEFCGAAREFEQFCKFELYGGGLPYACRVEDGVFLPDLLRQRGQVGRTAVTVVCGDVGTGAAGDRVCVVTKIDDPPVREVVDAGWKAGCSESAGSGSQETVCVCQFMSPR